MDKLHEWLSKNAPLDNGAPHPAAFPTIAYDLLPILLTLRVDACPRRLSPRQRDLPPNRAAHHRRARLGARYYWSSALRPRLHVSPPLSLISAIS